MTRDIATSWRRLPAPGSTTLPSVGVIFVAAAAALGSSAAPLAAQDTPLGESLPERENCVCFEGMPGPDMGHAFFRMRRARLGVVLGEPAEVGGRTGVTIDEVTEGSPAARGGLREGDVVVTFDGEALGDAPTRALLERMADVDPGDTVSLGYHRDGRDATARVVADEAPGVSFAWDGPGGTVMAPRIRALPHAPALRELNPGVLYRNLLFDGVELVDLNEGLGRYFGTSEGVLVVDIEEGSSLGLRPGDVILGIDGREPQDAGHARSIIASYRPDEPIRFDVMRDERRSTVTGTRTGERGR